MHTFEAYDFSPSPRQIKQIYDDGYRGVRPRMTRAARDRAIDAMPRFHAAFPEAKRVGKGKLAAPYRIVLTLDPEFGKYEKQTTGDCVSHSSRNAGMLDYCVDAFFGETSYAGRLATENIYGYRGHGGEGADCTRLAQYVSTTGPGGFLTRKRYQDGAGDSVDLTNYNSRIGHQWGRGGTPTWLNEIAAKNPSQRVYPLTSLIEAADALYCGFGITMCSGLGFSSRRNEHGVARPQGSWAHAMAWIGCDWSDWAVQTYGGPLFLVQNSWGEWNHGPTRHDQPAGSFWITHDVAEQMIRGRGGLVIASVRGYERAQVYEQADQANREFYLTA